MMHPRLRYLGGGFVRRRMRRQAAQFLRDAADPRGTQERVLRELLALNADSDFSRRHGLHEVRDAAEFRRRLPVADYESFRQHIDRLRQGHLSALLGSQNPLLMFALTSGTTASAKYIPITRRFLEDYRRGWKVWGIRAYDDHPTLHLLDIVQLSSDHDQFRTPAGHPCGNISGLVSAMQSPLVKTMYAVPDAVARIRSPEDKYYTALRLAIANPRIGLVMTANPSTLIQIAKLGESRKYDLIRDVADGALSVAGDVPDAVRRALRRRIARRDPRRARELEQIVARTGRLLPRDYWPRLALLAVWTGGSAGAYTAGLRACYGDAPIRDHGLSASEGRMTIPLADQRADGLLDVGSHYFEFIPEREHGARQPVVLAAHELQAGENYYILLTTASGLYRYDIRDVVRCTGHEQGTPLLEFLNKGAHISSVTGEKLAESQVVAALRQATVEICVELSHYTVTPLWGDPPEYRLLMEESDLAERGAARLLCERADACLQELNVEYREKRQSGRLAPLGPTLLPAGTWLRFARARQSELGGSIEQYKHPCLAPSLKFHEQLLSAAGRADGPLPGIRSVDLPTRGD